jgi:hypothetical protein
LSYHDIPDTFQCGRQLCRPTTGTNCQIGSA